MTMITRRELGQGVAASAVALALPGVARAAPAGWSKLTTEPYRGKQDDISFVDPQTGWYGNGAGKLYRTVDGGEIWAKVADKPGTFIRALGFIDTKTGFVGNVGTDYYPGVTDKQPLYRTDDGGATWTPVKADGIEKVAGICGIDIMPVTRVFQGEPRRTHIIHAAGRVGGPAMMLKSMDSGDNWTVEDLSAQAGMILDVKFLDAMTGFVCAATNSDLGQSEALILRTGDGGKSWKPVYQSGRKFENVWKMCWPSKRVGYATVQSYDEAPTNTHRVIVKTTDGGRSWRELPLVTAAGVQEFGIGFVDEKRGWVGCKAGGYETRDGGKSWAAIDFGRAVNKVRIVRGDGGVARAFAIGVDVHRLDLNV
jgi:photosystem II stability/assembly factor-like uncharacterized protein